MATLEHYNFRKTRRKSPPAKPAPKVDIKPKKDPTESEEELLRDFDLNYDYGPMIGMTRLERWERAKSFGLNPDPKVRDLIQRHSGNPKYTQCLWDNSLLGNDSLAS